MAKYFIPDSVASEVHEREIPDHFVEGLPLGQAVAVIHAWDGYNIMGNDSLDANDNNRTYDEAYGVGVLEVNTDRSHYYGIVYHPTDKKIAKKVAKKLLKSW